MLRPASVAQRLDAADSAPTADSASTAESTSTAAACAKTDPVLTTDPSSSTGTPSVPDRRPERGEGLFGRVMGFADAAPVRSVHWFLGPRGTLIAESAWGSGTSAVLVGWAPHDSDSAQGVAGGSGSHAAKHRAPLPGALLLGVFDTADTARRLAELVPESGHADIALVGRWALPDVCSPMSVHSVVHPEPGVLRRELVTQLTEAFVRVQESAAEDAAREAAAQEGAQTRTLDSRR